MGLFPVLEKMRAVFAVAVVSVGIASCVQRAAASEPARPDVGQLLQDRDMAGAVAAARVAAEAGDPDGQFNLSLFYWHGVAVPQNFQDAMRWVTLAAIGGHPKAPKAREAMLKSVEPAAQKKIMEWIRARLQKAGEEGGDDRALVLMSMSFAPEFGFEDNKEGYYWASLAVAAGQANARRRRDALIKGLSPAEVASTQERASVWFTKWRKDNRR